MTDLPRFPTVTEPVFHWADQPGVRIAFDDGTRRLSFAALAACMRSHAAAMPDTDPAIAWLPDTSSQIDRLIAFFAIAASGRAAAVADPDWPDTVHRRVMEVLPRIGVRPVTPTPQTPFYVGFTSGSTALPKAFIRDHHSWTESFRVCLEAFGEAAALPVVAPGRISHSLFLFAALLGVWSGAGVHLQDRFSARACLATLEKLDASCLVAVPSQLLLLIEAGERRGPIAGVKLILISGARWMRAKTPRLRALFPAARIVEFYGASETSFIAWTESREDLPATLVGRPFPSVDLAIREAAHDGAPGLIFVRSPMLFGRYLLGDDGATIRDGDWLSVRDRGYLDSDGALYLLGREQRMIVTQGKNLFPEEVEAVLERHPGIAAASVIGLPDALRGMRIAALIQPSNGTAIDVATLPGFCRDQLAGFKIPRQFFLRRAWPRTASGKTDHAELAAEFAETPE